MGQARRAITAISLLNIWLLGPIVLMAAVKNAVTSTTKNCSSGNANTKSVLVRTEYCS